MNLCYNIKIISEFFGYLFCIKKNIYVCFINIIFLKYLIVMILKFNVFCESVIKILLFVLEIEIKELFIICN